ncbi:MAG: HAD family hydrolase [Acutalibacteraceae bacterium]
MYKNVIFDLDGTLVNSLLDLAGSMNRALVANGLKPHPEDAYNYFVGNGVLMLVKRAIGEKNLTQELQHSVKAYFDNDYEQHKLDKTAPYSGIYDMLKTLNEKQIKIAVLSNKPDEFVAQMMKKLFSGITFAAAWGKKQEYKIKPDPQAVFAIMQKIKAEKDSTLYVGDSDVDVYTAQNAGIDFCGVNWGFRGKEELLQSGAKKTVDTAQDLLAYILFEK